MVVAALMLSVLLALPASVVAYFAFELSLLQALALYSGMGSGLVLLAATLSLLSASLRPAPRPRAVRA